jgi:hypothetical protein
MVSHQLCDAGRDRKDALSRWGDRGLRLLQPLCNKCRKKRCSVAQLGSTVENAEVYQLESKLGFAQVCMCTRKVLG